ncbi:MAG: response regulator [Myxococcales bacterium]|nr:response regulator [Myxococcales bacterium]MCB9543827.1 response regulator [Myxococcales bacterium]MCB9551828.1 response regulator [Myxococcales bacterium]
MERKYCPSCGQEVPLERTLQGNYLMIACKLCGLGLGVKLASADELRRLSAGDEAPSLARVEVVKRSLAISPAVEKPSPPDPRSAAPRDAAPPSVPPPEVEAVRRATEGAPLRQMGRVMLAEDSTFLRQITRDLLLSKQLCREVVDCEDGVSFVEAYTRALAEGERPDLVVLDVRMPGLDGRQAAFAMRAVETALGVKKRTPILFFSAVLCDEPFKLILAELGNARYIRKSDDGDAQQLGNRIVSVLGRLVGG